MTRAYLTGHPAVARRVLRTRIPFCFQWSPRRRLALGGIRFDDIPHVWNLRTLGADRPVSS